MSVVLGAAPALPLRVHTQEEIAAVLAPIVSSDASRQAVLRRIHANAGVRTRHHVLPIEDYALPRGVGRTNELWVEHGTALAVEAAAAALERAGVRADEVDVLVFTSVTGVDAPSIDARLAPLLGLRRDVKRMPMFGLGCVAGAAGLARAAELVGPDGVALLVAVETCSLTIQHGDDSMDNIVASGLFGDGAGAVVVGGDGRSRSGSPRILGSRSALFPDSHDAIGFRLTDSGFRVVLTADVVPAIDAGLRAEVEALLREHGVRMPEVATWIAHPGGPRVLDAIERNLELPPHALTRSRDALAAVGNLSSASVLQLLAEELGAEHAEGERGVMVAFGPGVSSEVVLLEW